MQPCFIFIILWYITLPKQFHLFAEIVVIRVNLKELSFGVITVYDYVINLRFYIDLDIADQKYENLRMFNGEPYNPRTLLYFISL